MQLNQIEYISEQLERISQKLNAEDAYYVKDVIMTNLQDPDMPSLVQEILDLNGYEDDVMGDVLALVIDIQESVVGDN